MTPKHDERRAAARSRGLLREPEDLRLWRNVRGRRRSRGYYEIDLAQPSIKRKGRDLTIYHLWPALYTAIAARMKLNALGLAAEIIDLRTANPLDYDLLVESVRKTAGSCSFPTRWSAAA